MMGRLSLTFTLAAGVNEHELPEVLDLLFREERVELRGRLVMC